MSKVICDICGTVYQNTVGKCPICGHALNRGMKKLEDEILMDVEHYSTEDSFASHPRKHKAIFDFDEVNQEAPVKAAEEEEVVYSYSDMEAEEEQHKTNMFLVVILVIVITLLLLASGFIFLRYFLPNMVDKAQATAPTEITEQLPTEEETIPTEDETIPCESLVLTGGVAELNRQGQPWLLHVKVMPQDTTDVLTYVSADETVATVNEDGKIIAVSEGETVVTISCGEQEIKCPVIVRYVEETVAQEESVPPLTVDGEETAQVTQPEETTEQTQPTEETAAENTEAATAETTETAETTTIVLKLKDKDRSSNKKGVSFTLELDCDLKPEDVKWLTMDSNVAIVKNGVVTTIGRGTTRIVALYGDQRAECIIRCTF